jgi:hypothetical protein
MRKLCGKCRHWSHELPDGCGSYGSHKLWHQVVGAYQKVRIGLCDKYDKTKLYIDEACPEFAGGKKGEQTSLF